MVGVPLEIQCNTLRNMLVRVEMGGDPNVLHSIQIPKVKEFYNAKICMKYLR